MCLKSSSVIKAKAEGTLQKVGEMIHSSPSILSSKGEVGQVVLLFVTVDADKHLDIFFSLLHLFPQLELVPVPSFFSL